LVTCSIGNCEKTVYINTCLILNGYRHTAVGISTLNSVRFLLWGWIKSEFYRRKVTTSYEFLARILNAAAGIKKRADQIRRKTPGVSTRVAKCSELDGGIFERLSRTVTNLSFVCNKFAI
jgi:hypothetical protein